MTESNAHSVFERFVTALNAGEFAALDELIHPDFEDLYPQSGERTRGPSNLRAILENYPGGFVGGGVERVVGAEDRWISTPRFSLLRIEGSGDTFTTVSRGRYPDGRDWYIVNIGQVRDGRIWRVETYFAPTFEPPAWRSAWVERAAE